MAEIKDKLITAENLKNAYDDNKRQINELKGDLVNEKSRLKSEISRSVITDLNHENELTDLREKLNFVTSARETSILCEDGELLTDEEESSLTVFVYSVITDESLKESNIPADAKAVGEIIERFSNRIRDANIFHAEKYNLPVLRLYGDMSEISKDKKVNLTYLYSKGISGECTLKWQGSSSLLWEKKNYTLSLDRDVEMKGGWGKHKKYCLKANYIDFSHSRNIVSARLWSQIVKDRKIKENNIYTISTENNVDISTEDNAIFVALTDRILSAPNCGAVDGFPIALYINDEYKGLYTLNIPKDSYMFGMGDLNTEYIITAEYSADFKNNVSYEMMMNGEIYAIEYVKNQSDAINAANSFNNLITSANNYSNSNKSLENYLDINSFIDYYIFSMLLNATDCLVRNYIMYTYDGKKWAVSAYDLDTTFGNTWDGKAYEKINNLTTFANSFHYNRLFEILQIYFKDELKERYAELRETILSEDNIFYEFSNFLAEIPSAMKQEENKIWTNLYGTETNNLAQIINFYRLKCEFLDNEISHL